jgi:mono/diheme cytochrome c family protein
VNRILAVVGTAALGTSLAVAGVGLAQTKTTKKAAAGKTDTAAVARGKDLFQQKCSTCHYDTSDAKKIGPGLKGLNKRGTFTVNNNKVTDDNLKTWIENGDSLMPPFKDVIDDNQIKDVIAYVKTL